MDCDTAGQIRENNVSTWDVHGDNALLVVCFWLFGGGGGGGGGWADVWQL